MRLWCSARIATAAAHGRVGLPQGWSTRIVVWVRIFDGAASNWPNADRSMGCKLCLHTDVHRALSARTPPPLLDQKKSIDSVPLALD